MRFAALSFALALTLALISPPARAEEDPDEPPPVVKPSPEPSPTPTPKPASTPVPTQADVVETPPPEKAPPSPAEASVSWTVLGAQAPEGTAIVTVAFGFSGLPQAAFHYAVADNLSIGVTGGFDYARFVPSNSFNAAGSIGASVKGSYFLDETLHLGWRADFGFLIPERPDFGIIIDVSAHLLVPINRQLYVGGGIDIPLTIGIGDGSFFSWPLLVGGVAEFHVLAPLALYAEAKLGPAFLAPGGAYLGARVMGGLAYRL